MKITNASLQKFYWNTDTTVYFHKFKCFYIFLNEKSPYISPFPHSQKIYENFW